MERRETRASRRPDLEDADVGYHDPKVENLTNALLGIHRGLSRQPLPTNYQGIAIYCEWETSEAEWQYIRKHFLNQTGAAKENHVTNRKLLE